MSKADDIFWRQFGSILAALTLFGIVMFFLARIIAGDAFERQSNAPSAVLERIAPVATVRVGDPSATVAPPEATAAPAESAQVASATPGGGGEGVYNGACSACHATGAAGAPKLDDAPAWAPRVEQGLDALVGSVLGGKGAMPPKGGMASLSEAQIRDAVEYMLSEVGAAGGGTGPTAAATHAVETAAGAATAMAKQATEVVATAAEQASAAVASATEAESAGQSGDAVYNKGCVACHATGAANAPKLTDKAAWEPRAAAGFAALVQSVLKGKGAMPPKGGLATLSDADIENAVRYMLQQAGVEAGG